MTDIEITLSSIEEIINASRRDLPIESRCALRAGLDILLSEIEEHRLHLYNNIDPYTAEKIRQLRWSVNANLGFASTNGHDETSHRAWSLGALSIIERLLTDQPSNLD